MFVRNPNSNYTVETDEELSYVPLNNKAFDDSEDEDIYIHKDDSDQRYLPPFLNNPLTDLLFGPSNPPGPPGGPGGGPPGGGFGGPPGPPPSMTPSKSGASFQSQGFFGGPQVKAVSPGSIRPCRFQFVYIWLRNGRSFWAWLTYVDRRTASGFRWNGRRWVYFGVDLRRIDYFECYGRNSLRASEVPEDLRNMQGPPGAPPSMTPTKPATAFGAQPFAVSPESISRCRFQFVYIWLKNGTSFWAWLIDVDRKTATGFRWTGRSWTFFGVSLSRIEFFQCFGRDCLGDSEVSEDSFQVPEDLRNVQGPPGPPPSMTPSKSGTSFQSQSSSGGPQAKAVSPGSIRPCRFQFVYIWLRNGTSFWAWLINVDRRTASGFRWNGRRWVYFGVDLRRIDYFECYGRDNNRGFGNPFENLFGPPSGPPGGANGPGGNQDGPPGPPPSSTPSKSNVSSQSLMGGPQVKAVSPGSIKPCLYQYVYIWLNNGRSFWAWLTRVDKKSASGYRWTGFNWTYFGVDLKSINYFECYGRRFEGRSDKLVKKAGLPDVNNMSNLNATENANTMGNLANMQDLANMNGAITPTPVNMVNVVPETIDTDLDLDLDTEVITPVETTETMEVPPPVQTAENANVTTDISANLEPQTLEPEKIKVDYPVIKDLPNEEVQNNINDAIISEVTSLLNNQVLVPEQKDIKEVEVSYQVPLMEKGLLCIVFSIYINATMNQNNTVFSSLTFDTNTGEKYELEDLFKDDCDYENLLSDMAVKKCDEIEVPLVSDYEGLCDNQQYYLTPNGIVLFYQVDEYTPSSYGLFRIPIGYEELGDLLNTYNPVCNFLY